MSNSETTHVLTDDEGIRYGLTGTWVGSRTMAATYDSDIFCDDLEGLFADAVSADRLGKCSEGRSFYFAYDGRFVIQRGDWLLIRAWDMPFMEQLSIALAEQGDEALGLYLLEYAELLTHLMNRYGATEPSNVDHEQ